MSDPVERLRKLLGSEPPAGVGNLSPDAQARLAELIAGARARQRRSLEEAFTATLRHVPFPVRGLVRRVLVG
jgi:hypothetical protein